MEEDHISKLTISSGEENYQPLPVVLLSSVKKDIGVIPSAYERILYTPHTSNSWSQPDIQKHYTEVKKMAESVTILPKDEAEALFEKFPKSVQKKLTNAIECLLTNSDQLENFPNGDDLLTYTMTYITKENEYFGVNTVVCIEETNKATLNVVYPNVHIHLKTMEIIISDPKIWIDKYNKIVPKEIAIRIITLDVHQELKTCQHLSNAFEEAALDAGKAIATTVVDLVSQVEVIGTVLGPVAQAILGAFLEELFPTVPSYFGEVYKEIKIIVKEEISANNITLINGNLNSIEMRLKIDYYVEYSAVKNNMTPANALNLQQYLKSIYQTFFTGTGSTISLLMQKGYAKAGFGVFLFGANLQLAVLGEMASLYPQDKPLNERTKAIITRKWAKAFYDHSRETWDEMKKDRRNLISYVYRPSNNGVPEYRPAGFRIYDYYIGRPIQYIVYSLGKNESTPQHVINAVNSHRKRVVNDLSNKLRSPDDFIAKFKKIAESNI